MRVRRIRLVLAALAIAAVSASPACKSNEVNQTQNTNNNFSTTVGPEGKLLEGPGGTKIRIPPGAVDEPTEITIKEATADEYPPLIAVGGVGPTGTMPFEATGKVWAFLPHGQQFFVEPTFWLPAPPGRFGIMKAQPGQKVWDFVDDVTSADGLVQFKSSSFSYYVVRDFGSNDAGPGTGADADSSDGGSGSGGSDSGGSGSGGSDSGAGTDVSICPTMTQTEGTATFTAFTPVSAYAFYKENLLGSTYYSQLYLVLSDRPEVCTRVVSGQGSANGKTLRLRLEARNTTSPTVFTAGTYASGSAYGVTASSEEYDAKCDPTGSGLFYSNGTVIITEATGGRYKGTFSFPTDGVTPASSGSFDVPTCASDRPSGGVDDPSCCR